jgi:hypothetical protein
MDIMSWPGHDEAPEFEIGSLFSFGWPPAIRARIGNVVSHEVIVRLAQGLIVLFVLAALTSLVIFQSDVKASLSKTLERVALSAEAQGKLFPYTMHMIATKISE